MHEIVPSALVECVKLGKTPTREQINSVAEHVWSDWCRAMDYAYSALPADRRLVSYLTSIAWLALTGEVGEFPADQEENNKQTADARLLLEIAC